MTNRENVLAILFADEKYKDEAGFYLTSDDQAFTKKNENDAKNHAKSLEDKDVEWCPRKKSIAKVIKDAVSTIVSTGKGKKGGKVVEEETAEETAKDETEEEDETEDDKTEE